jgi:hypothetical protein
LNEADIPPISENNGSAAERSSPWIMVSTMLLLICGLILTSATLLHYAAGMQPNSESSGVSLLNFKGLIEHGLQWSEQVKFNKSQSVPDQADQEEQHSTVKRFFSGSSDETIRWPKLKLTGFGKSSDAEGAFAIINGQHVLVNTYIDEVKLVEVRTHGAWVEYRGERKFLTLQNK